MACRKYKMLVVTDNAKQHLKGLLAGTGDPDTCVRLVLESGHLILFLSREGPGDYVVEHQGAKVLLVGPELVPVVDGTTLDARGTPGGTRLVISK